MRNRMYNPSPEERIQDFFYKTLAAPANELANRMLDGQSLPKHELEQTVKSWIVQLLNTLLNQSVQSRGILLPTGLVVTNENCPERYQPLFGMLIQLKESSNYSQHNLMVIAGQVMQLESFKSIGPVQTLLELGGLAEPKLANIHADETGITTDLIRRTFYEEMVNQAFLCVTSDWITIEDLESREPEIYFTLPALTLLEAIQQSQQYAGIRLLDGKCVTQDNCPNAEGFPMLVDTLIKAKEKIKSMSPEQVNTVKYILAHDGEVSDELAQHKTTELMNSLAVLKGMATQITQRQVFKNTVDEVIKKAIEIFSPEPSNAKRMSN